MFGKNPIRPPVFGEGHSLAVQEIFTTFQGEGPYTGVPAIFLRLGGCNLACTFCDTEFEQFSEMPLDSIMNKINELKNNDPSAPRLVVITGGEPFRQPIGPVCERLIESGFKVQIETNGTLYREVPEAVEIVCSPKAPSGRYAPIHGGVINHLNALKILVSNYHDGYDKVPALAPSHIPLYLQPIDTGDAHKNSTNLQLVRELAAMHNARVCHQLHKMAGVP